MKRTVSLLLALLLCMALVVTAYADGTVTYDGDAQKFIFAPGSSYSPTDLFDGMKNVFPGDTRTQQIEVNNTRLGSKKINVYLKALPAEGANADFLSKLHLTVKQGGTTLFDTTVDRAGGLSDWVKLATLSGYQKTVLDLTLTVPAELDNRYQDAIGTVTWKFKVEELQTPINPKTGDDLPFVLLLILFALSLVVIAVLLYSRKRRQPLQEQTKASDITSHQREII